MTPENQEEPQEINQPMPRATEEDQDTIDNDESTEELSTSEETNVGQQQPRRSTRKREPPDRHGVVITGKTMLHVLMASTVLKSLYNRKRSSERSR